MLYGNGDGTIREGTFYLLDSYPGALFAADLNGDKRTDIVVSLAAKHAAGAEPRVDLNGDGKLDAPFWDDRGGNNPSELEILGGQGGGTFAPPAAFSVGTSPSSIRAIRLVKGGSLNMLIETTSNTSTTESLLINKE